MFWKKKREVSPFGDEGYQMKESYLSQELVVANFQRVSSRVTDFGPMVETTEQKYIFEPIVSGDEVKYREVFTGFIASSEEEYLNVPYVVNPLPFDDYFNEEKEIEIPKLGLIWYLNDINYPSEKDGVKILKKSI